MRMRGFKFLNPLFKNYWVCLTTFESGKVRGEKFGERLVHPRTHVVGFSSEEGNTLLDETVKASETNRAFICGERNVPIIRLHGVDLAGNFDVGNGVFVGNVGLHRNVHALRRDGLRNGGDELTILRGGLGHINSYIEVEGRLSN